MTNEAIDYEEFRKGFSRGDCASAYEAESYDVAQNKLSGKTGFYRIGHLLGFFGTCEIHEVPSNWTNEVEKYRVQFSKWI